MSLESVLSMLVLNKNNDDSHASPQLTPLSGECTWKENVRMSNYQRLMLLCTLSLYSYLGSDLFLRKDTAQHRNYRKRNQVEHDQRDEIHLKVYSTVHSTRYTALTENGEGFFFCWFCCFFKLQAWQHTVQLSLFLLPAV